MRVPAFYYVFVGSRVMVPTALCFAGVLRSRGADQPGHYYVVVQGGQRKKKVAGVVPEERVSVNIQGQSLGFKFSNTAFVLSMANRVCVFSTSN